MAAQQPLEHFLGWPGSRAVLLEGRKPLGDDPRFLSRNASRLVRRWWRRFRRAFGHALRLRLRIWLRKALVLHRHFTARLFLDEHPVASDDHGSPCVWGALARAQRLDPGRPAPSSLAPYGLAASVILKGSENWP